MSLTNYFPAQIRSIPAFDGHLDAFKLSAEVRLVLSGIYPAGTVITPHRQSLDNVGVIIKGSLLLTINGESQHIAAGAWYFEPAGAEYVA